MITLEFQHIVWIVGLIVAWSGLLFAGIRWLMVRVVGTFDESFKSLVNKCERLDADFKTLLINLPIEYQRREDSIREYTVFNAKLDKTNQNIYELNQNIKRIAP